MLGVRRCDVVARSALRPCGGVVRSFAIGGSCISSPADCGRFSAARRASGSGCRAGPRLSVARALSSASASHPRTPASSLHPPAPSRELWAALRAVRLASRATESVARRLAAGGSAGSRSKEDGSPVTVADLAAQALVSWSLWRDLGARPRLIAEESADRLREGIASGGAGHSLAVKVGEEVCAAIEAELGNERGGSGAFGTAGRDESGAFGAAAAAAAFAVDAAAPPPIPTSVSAVLDLIDVGRPDVDALDPPEHAARRGSKGVSLSPASSSAPWWLLDPVDGTRGFLAGRAYAIALSLIDPVSGDAVLGVLGCPTLSVMRDAEGAGATGVGELSSDGGVSRSAPNSPEGTSSLARIPPSRLESTVLTPQQRSGAASGGALAFAETGRGAWATELWGSNERLAEATLPFRATTPRDATDPLTSPLPDASSFAVPLHVSGSSGRLTTSAEARHGDAPLAERAAKAAGFAAPSLRLDSQAKYALVAAGAAVAYCRLPRLEGGHVEKAWDHAAGEILVREAGGRVSDGAGRALDFSCGARLAVRSEGGDKGGAERAEPEASAQPSAHGGMERRDATAASAQDGRKSAAEAATAMAQGERERDSEGPVAPSGQIRAIVAAPGPELEAFLAALRVVAPDRAT